MRRGAPPESKLGFDPLLFWSLFGPLRWNDGYPRALFRRQLPALYEHACRLSLAVRPAESNRTKFVSGVSLRRPLCTRCTLLQHAWSTWQTFELYASESAHGHHKVKVVRTQRPPTADGGASHQWACGGQPFLPRCSWHPARLCIMVPGRVQLANTALRA